MNRRVAIVGYAQSRHQYDMPKTREDMVFDVVKEAIGHAGISRSKVEEDGAMAMQYAMMKLQSASCDIALVEAHTQGYTFNPHQAAEMTLDPLFDRQVGIMNDVAAAAIQANMYMDANDVSEEHLALVSAKNLSNAANNTNAHRRMADVTIEEILDSKLYYTPITELLMSPVSDGAAAVILAAEDVARDICDDPVWVQGIGSCSDGYLRDRDLTSLTSLKKAAGAAYEMAGIQDPFNELDVVEISERYAHEELMAYEALGLCREGRGKALIENGVTDVEGDLPVNVSGGALGADPICATGLVRVIEATKLIRGEGAYSPDSGINRALAHGQFGICAQKNIVYVLGSEV